LGRVVAKNAAEAASANFALSTHVIDLIQSYWKTYCKDSESTLPRARALTDGDKATVDRELMPEEDIDLLVSTLSLSLTRTHAHSFSLPPIVSLSL
jgi:hypothetical protein